MNKIINTDKAPKAVGPYSQAVMTGKLLFISGQIPFDPGAGKIIEGGAAEQTGQVFKNIGAILKSAGLDFCNIVKTTVYLDNINDFAEMNKIYSSYFSCNFPARAACEVSALPLGVLVEIEAVAAAE